MPRPRYLLKVQGCEISKLIIELPNGAQLVSTVLANAYGSEGTNPGVPGRRATKLASCLGWIFPNAQVKLELVEPDGDES